MKAVRIRRARHGDIPELAKLNRMGLKEVKEWTPYSVKEMGGFLKFRDLLLVAETKGEIAGFITGYYYTFVPPMKAKWGRNCVGVDNLFVRKGFRGRGIGKALIRELARRWKNRGCRYIEVSVTEKDKLGYYRKLGFNRLLYLPYRKV